MLWKSAKPAAPGQPPRVWSITRRFTVLYVMSAAVLLLLTCLFFYWTLSRSLSARDHALLLSKVKVLRSLLQKPEQKEVLSNEVEHEASESPVRYYLRIIDQNKRVSLETPEMAELLPPNMFPAPVHQVGEELSQIDEHVVESGSYLLLSAQVPGVATNNEPWTLQLALDISADQALLAAFRLKLLLVLLLGLGLAAVVGGWMARKGAQPLVEITARAQQITASQLNERIAISQWPAELAELAAAFNAMLDRLQNSFQRLSQFSGDLAHELRTPISNLRGEAEVALARCRTPEEYQQVLASSLEEFERLSRIIEGLLFLARADNPASVVHRVPFDAGKEARSVCAFYEAAASEKGVDLACSGEARVAGDAMLFRRALGNLVGNALQHTPTGGTVTVGLSALHDDPTRVIVRDTGVGIAPEHLAKIFDRFYRVDSSRNRHSHGFGLGLAIVQSIMRMHGGAVDVQSEVGKGTTFTLHFPATGSNLQS